jgi:hypothetical protein
LEAGADPFRVEAADDPFSPCDALSAIRRKSPSATESIGFANR